MTEFRMEGLAAAKAQAAVFGYKGAQFPWCTVSFGRSSGCCTGKGGFELCLEQHITPDVGFAMQQYFRWTGDVTWLREIGWPIVKGVAEWLVSRVYEGSDGAYHIRKVMPVDEWCHQASGCVPLRAVPPNFLWKTSPIA
jgi:trehalose/maltose hydrolase-like predicted phosphorylase